MFFVLPPNDHILVSEKSVAVVFVSLEAAVSVASGLVTSVPSVPHLVDEPQPPVHPPNPPKVDVVPLVVDVPKVRSNLGALLSKSMSSKVLAVGGLVAGGSGSDFITVSKAASYPDIMTYLSLFALFWLLCREATPVVIPIRLSAFGPG